MVTIQPFEYEKTTAFKERVQIANKVNEIINLFNELDIESKINVFNEEIVIINGKITEINNALNEVNTAVNTVEGYNTRLTSVENESISLDARLDNIEPVVSSNTAKIGVLENKDLENVKLSGNQTIEDIKTYVKSPIVPNPPSGDTSTKVVNTNWISQSGDTSPNNLLHKNGNETKTGDLTFKDKIISMRNHNNPNITCICSSIPDIHSIDASWVYPIIFRANDLSELGHLTFGRNSNGKSYLTLTLIDSNGISKTIMLGVND